MQIILLERVPNLGQMGDEVSVKDGYARNFLLPQGKALRATAANRARFEQERAQIEARNLEARKEAEAVAEKLNGKSFTAIRSASDTGQLYGSVSTRDIASLLTESGFSAARQQVVLNNPIKQLGLHEIQVRLHPEVYVDVTINVARSEEEAQAQARGVDVLARGDEEAADEQVVDVADLLEEPAMLDSEFVEEEDIGTRLEEDEENKAE